jgi:hypothetical protein
MQFVVRLEDFSRNNFNGLYLYQAWQSSIAILDIVRCTGKGGFLVRYARLDGFLRLYVTNTYQQHCVWMLEMEDG